MKKHIINLLKYIGVFALAYIISIIIPALFLGIMIASSGEPTIMQSVESPDGKYTAYVFERNAGATSGWVYHISVLKTGKGLPKGNGNIYTSEAEPGNVEWLDNTTLYVEDWNEVEPKRKGKIYDVTVKFRSLENKT